MFLALFSLPSALGTWRYNWWANSFSYFLTYKFSRDHLELLFSCIRGKNGFNNNPDVRTFKSVLKRILLRVSVVASNRANCLVFEEESTSTIFSLKWAPLSPEMEEPYTDNDVLESFPSLSESTHYKDPILAYIGEYIFRKLSRKLTWGMLSSTSTARRYEQWSIQFNKIKRSQWPVSSILVMLWKYWMFVVLF